MDLSRKRFWIALGVSFLAHWLFVAFAPVEPPDSDEKDTVLTTKITSMPPPPMPVAAAAPKSTAPVKAKPKKPTAHIPPNTSVAALPPSLEPKPEEPAVLPVPEKVAEKPPEPEPEPKKEEEKVAEVEPLPMSAAHTSGAMFASAGLSEADRKAQERLEALPRVIDLNFKAAYAQGENYPLPVGTLKLRFEHEGDKYELRTMGQASGFFRMLYPGVMRMKSVGTLKPEGIVPDSFELVREREGREPRPRKVVFDRQEKLIRLNEKPPVPMTGPVYDVLTFIVQFYFAIPDKDEVTFQVVSPTRVDAYTLKRVGKEMLDTPQGKIEMEVWKGSRKEAAGAAEFWLAPSWHYIPFKVRMVDEQERKAEFVLESIATEATKPKT